MARHWRAAKEILRDEVSDEALAAASVARRASNSFAQILTASLPSLQSAARRDHGEYSEAFDLLSR
jgi:hypothetical protein